MIEFIRSYFLKIYFSSRFDFAIDPRKIHVVDVQDSQRKCHVMITEHFDCLATNQSYVTEPLLSVLNSSKYFRPFKCVLKVGELAYNCLAVFSYFILHNGVLPCLQISTTPSQFHFLSANGCCKHEVKKINCPTCPCCQRYHLLHYQIHINY